jgi:hypothetical protein
MAFLKSDALFRAFCGGIGSGKTWAGAYDLIRRAKPGRLYLVVAPTYSMLSDATFRMFVGLAEQLGLVDRGDVKRSAPPSVRLRTGAEVLFRSADEPDRLRGPNLSGLWMDEASLMHVNAYTVAIGRLRQAGEMGWLSATFTPQGRLHWTYDVFAKGRPGTAIFYSETRDNPFLPPLFHDTIRAQYGDGALSDQELAGRFIDDDGAMRVIPVAWVHAAQQHWVEMHRQRPGPPVGVRLSALGVDVARGGKDKTVIARRYGSWFAPLIKRPGSATPNGVSVAILVQSLLAENAGALVNIDAFGVGAGAFGECRARLRGARVFPVLSGDAVHATDRTGVLRFVNLRAFLLWSMRELLDPANRHNVALPPDPDLLADLSAANFEMTSSGIKVERKEEMVKRLGRSPDCADSVCYSILLPPWPVH